MNRALVLVPTYNERRNLPLVAERLEAVKSVDVLVIDDGSPDGTGALADEIASRSHRIRVLHRAQKEGLGRAYVEGLRFALDEGYTFIVTMDADLSHRPEDVPRLLEALERADIAIGSRYAKGGGVESWPKHREILSRAGNLYARFLLRLRERDVTSGFRAYRSDALSRLDLDGIVSKGFVFQVEILRRVLDLPGARAEEVPILFRNRAHGRSKLSGSIVREGVLGVLKLACTRGKRKPTQPEFSLRGVRSAEDAPSISIVIPTRPHDAVPRALVALSRLESEHEIVVVRSKEPSRARNEALRRTRGDYVLFLDDDSEPEPDLIERLKDTIRRFPSASAIGGPAILGEGSSSVERISSAVFSEPCVVGRSASRYTPRGALRPSDERELILCNLLVSRASFEKLGGFDERLYPNEENELLERLRTAGALLLYDPCARVTRPAWPSWRLFFASAYRYGRGRGRQWRCYRSRTSGLRLALIGILGIGSLGAFATALLRPPSALFLVPVLFLYLLLLAVRFRRRLSMPEALGASLVSLLVLALYGVGAFVGLTLRWTPSPKGPLELEKVSPALSLR